LCPTPLGIGTNDTLVLSAFNDLQRSSSESSISFIPLRFDDGIDLVFNAPRHLTSLPFDEFADLYEVFNIIGILAIVASTPCAASQGIVVLTFHKSCPICRRC
jgi:hypothetical protein